MVRSGTELKTARELNKSILSRLAAPDVSQILFSFVFLLVKVGLRSKVKQLFTFPPAAFIIIIIRILHPPPPLPSPLIHPTFSLRELSVTAGKLDNQLKRFDVHRSGARLKLKKDPPETRSRTRIKPPK